MQGNAETPDAAKKPRRPRARKIKKGSWHSHPLENPSHKTKGIYIRRRVEFSVHAEPGSTVFLAGSFNDWNQQKKQLKDAAGNGDFRGILFLMPGRYEYKFIINGIWEIDAGNPDVVSNGLNSLNSVITVE